ncbi:hypothetical protein BDF22DRAFT_42681 [Syncephalis plumigaleata]|nr:hypothetical protein BDF22DRAFT_42681 [Syncephalis plumigaleata]
MFANLLIGGNTITTFAQRYVEANKIGLKLLDIQWSSRNKKTLSLARVNWENHDAFMKCAIVSVSGPIKDSEIDMEEVTDREIHAFNALKGAKGLTSLDTIGRQNVMDPLHQFEFYEENRIRYVCHLYRFIDGETLDEYFKRHTISQAYIATSQILPEIIKGAIYLYNAGIIHYDLLPKNIMLEKNPAGKPIVKIIDFDSTDVFEKGQDWRPISPTNEAYLPSQSASCNELNGVITEFLDPFVTLKQGENPYATNYVVTGQAALGYLNEFRENEDYAALQSGDINVAIPAMHYFLKVHYAPKLSPSVCTAPIRILRVEPPRAGTPSRPVSPTF